MWFGGSEKNQCPKLKKLQVGCQSGKERGSLGNIDEFFRALLPQEAIEQVLWFLHTLLHHLLLPTILKKAMRPLLLTVQSQICLTSVVSSFFLVLGTEEKGLCCQTCQPPTLKAHKFLTCQVLILCLKMVPDFLLLAHSQLCNLFQRLSIVRKRVKCIVSNISHCGN
jgi:hypothetical protein